jgi:hypothetical protein
VPGLRGLDRPEALDGDVACIATAALSRPPDGHHLIPLWSETPDEAGFLRFPVASASGWRESAALVAMWSCHYEATFP